MSTIQKILLILSCVFYVLTLFAGFRLGALPAVSFFMLHSLTIILFAFRVYKEGKDRFTLQDTHQQAIGQELANKDRTISELKEKIGESENRITEITREKENLSVDLEELKKNLEKSGEEKDELTSKLKEMEEKEPDSELSAALLPPVDEEEAGKSVDIIAIAKQAVDDLSENARNANLKVSVQSPTPSLMVKADAGRLVILFRNIIDNSIKYMKKAGSLVITISTINDDIFIVLKDTGEGLNEDETKHIFELNFQGSNRLSGNGLGLTQAKAIVECYGGTIYAKSTEGKGMGIYIQLPA